MLKIYRFKNRLAGHILLCLVALIFSICTILLGLSPNRSGMAIFTFVIVTANVYTGRWINDQSLKGNALDLFRMSFLSFFFLTLAGTIAFAWYVEPDQHFLHYAETWINVSVVSVLCLLFGFFGARAVKKRVSDGVNE